MSQLHNNAEPNEHEPKNDDAVLIQPKATESRGGAGKHAQSAANGANAKPNHGGKQAKDEEDLVEQDLSDEEDTYEEPSVQRYLPGIFVDVKLKTKTTDRNGTKVELPMIVDFYAECLKKYGDEKNFVYEESYLEHMRAKEEDLYPELAKFPKPAFDLADSQNAGPDKGPGDTQKGTPFDESLEDVIWLKNRPNDPLLRCIRSITDRLNIQGIVGDPTSYLKKGGDDMHYDMDDPFFDDSAMLTELKMSKSDILLKRAMEREFSDWTEDEEDSDYSHIEPEDFVADYYSDFEREMREQNETEGDDKLFFDPAGWRVYFAKVPKQFLAVYYEFENTCKKISEAMTERTIRVKVKELLYAIFKKVVKMTASAKTGNPKIGSKPTKKGNGETREAGEETRAAHEEAAAAKPEPEAARDEDRNAKPKGDADESSREILKRRGLNCHMPYKIVDVNGKILRWIVKSITAMTNACSEYEIHCEWFVAVLQHNERTVNEHANKIRAKLTTKLQALKGKRAENMATLVTESAKALSKSIGLIRKLLKEHKDIATPKPNKAGTRDAGEPGQRKSLIEISLDSTREDHGEYMGANEPIMEAAKEPEHDTLKLDDAMASQIEAFALEFTQDTQGSFSQGKKDPEDDTPRGKPGTTADPTLPEQDESSTSSSSNEEAAEMSHDAFIEALKKSLSAHNTQNGPSQHGTTPEHEFSQNSQTQSGSDDAGGAATLPDATQAKEGDQDAKTGAPEHAEPTTKSPKRQPQREDDLEGILKQSKVMKKVKDVYNLFKLVGADALVFVQMSNLAISVAAKLNTNDFKPLVEHMGITQNPFDQTYRRLGDIGARTMLELYNAKVTLPADVMKVVVINIQSHLRVEELYEKKNKKPLLLFSNAREKAPPGRVFLNPPKQKTPRKAAQPESPKHARAGESPTRAKETKARKKAAQDWRLAPDEPGAAAGAGQARPDEANPEGPEQAKKKRKAQPQSRVNSLKELLMSRVRT